LHQELAQLIGVTRKTCTIELGKLQKSGAVTFDDDCFMIVDPDRLEPGAFDRVRRTVLGT